jgi:hypothetical protein
MKRKQAEQLVEAAIKTLNAPTNSEDEQHAKNTDLVDKLIRINLFKLTHEIELKVHGADFSKFHSIQDDENKAVDYLLELFNKYIGD